MTLRIDVSTLSKDVRDSLARGESVEIERDGEVVACITAPATGDELQHVPETPMAKFLRLRREHGPVDEDFARDVELARKMMNEPVVTEPWE